MEQKDFARVKGKDLGMRKREVDSVTGGQRERVEGYNLKAPS